MRYSGLFRAFSGRLIVLVSVLSVCVSADARLSFGDAVNFNEGWLFELTSDSIAPSTPEFDDSRWRRLDLPHDWSVESFPSPTLNACTGFFPGGMGWYRKHFEVGDSLPVHYLLFEGVYNRSEVYLNGHLLGKRPNGYVSFYYDITPYLRDGDNVVAVKVDHTRQADSRWYTGSGIYRNVYVVGAGRTRFAPWGVGWHTRSADRRKAVVAVEFATVADSVPGKVEVDCVLADASGRRVASGSRRLMAGEKGELRLTVRNPQLWDVDSPYLYRLDVTMTEGGRVIDRTSSRVGIRTLAFDPDNGFALNGRAMKMKGVCMHHDAGVLGAAVPRAVWKRRLENLKEAGVNAIRMSHNPQAPVVYDLCDELGLLVMDEASDEWEFPKRKWVKGWNVGKPVFEGSSDFFNEWIETDVADMVRRDRNHACVALWSIGNEVDYPNDPYSHPVLDSVAINQPNFGGYDPQAPDAMRIGEIAKRLAGVVRSIDKSRPVTGALAGVVMSNQTAYPDAVDVVGYNYTENRYGIDHRTYPRRVIYGSENGHGYKQWLAVRDNDHIFGQFLWTGTDYLGESGVWPSRGLGTGLLDFGGFMKARGKFRASLWCENPVAFVGAYPHHGDEDPGLWIDAPAVWNYDAGQKMRVVCYTNCHSARLTLDGWEVGALALRDDMAGMIFWDIPFAPGRLAVEAFDAEGILVASDSIVTTGRPYALRASANTTTLTDGCDVAHVVVEVVDEEGNVVALADNMVDCRVEGGCRLLGVEGTGNSDMSHPRATVRRVCNGRLLVYVARGEEGGTSTLRFTSPLLQPAELKVESVAAAEGCATVCY